jgi:hypothetical protein
VYPRVSVQAHVHSILAHHHITTPPPTHLQVRHVAVADVQRYGSKALENLAARDNEQRIAIAEANAVQIILRGMKARGLVSSGLIAP